MTYHIPRLVLRTGWKTIGVKVRVGELPLLNRQLARFNYNTLGDLVKGLIAGIITQVTEDQQIEIMKTNLQTSGQLTGLSGKPYDFYKQIDVMDFLKYLIGRYSEHTAKCYVNYFHKYSTIFFSANPHDELLKLAHTKDPGFYKPSRDLVTTIIGSITIEKLFS